MDRLFLDANVFFSAAYRDDSGLRQLGELEDLELLTSAYAFEEARRNLDTDEHISSRANGTIVGLYFGDEIGGVRVMTPRQYLASKKS